VPVNEKAALNGPWPVTSVPMRSQSGASDPVPSLRMQLCRSGKNGVPGATIGFEAESQRKFPAFPEIDLGTVFSTKKIKGLRIP
jgi:hypothetical protein